MTDYKLKYEDVELPGEEQKAQLEQNCTAEVLMLKSIQQVVPHLFIGNVAGAWNEDLLNQNDIRHVVTVMGNSLYDPESTSPCGAVDFDYRPKTSKTNRIRYYHFKLADSDKGDISPPVLNKWVDLIHDYVYNERNVLVHCWAGMSRSAMLVMAYLIKYREMTTDQALLFLSERRSCVLPNAAFMQGLEVFENSLRAVAEPINPKVPDLEKECEAEMRMLKSIQQVVPRLFIGSVAGAWNEDLLIQNDIRHVVTVMGNSLYDSKSTTPCGCVDLDYKPQTTKTDHIHYHHFKLADMGDVDISPAVLNKWVDFVRLFVYTERNVLVHCWAGMSRSAMLVMAYLIKHKEMTTEQARSLVKERRPYVHPNAHFMQGLKTFENSLRAEPTEQK